MQNKIIDLEKSVFELCKDEPNIIEILSEIGFKDIKQPGMLKTVGRFMTISKGAAMKKIDINIIKKVFKDYGYEIKE